MNVDCLKRNHKHFIRNKKSMLKTQQSLKSERHQVFTKEINKIALSSDDNKKCNELIQ